MTEQQQLAIIELIGRFDFDKVHKAMTATDWRWLLRDGVRAIPSIDDMKECACEIAASCLKEGHVVSTGGFFVSQFKGEYGPVLELWFSMADAAVELDRPRR